MIYTNVQNVKRLKIIPCNRILVRDIENGNAEVELDDYNYIKDAGKYYIKLPANAAIEQIREALDFRTSVVEIFEASMERKDCFGYFKIQKRFCNRFCFKVKFQQIAGKSFRYNSLVILAINNIYINIGAHGSRRILFKFFRQYCLIICAN